MRSHGRKSETRLANRGLESAHEERKEFREDGTSDIAQKISLEQVSLDERRKEAEKPLYILRV